MLTQPKYINPFTDAGFKIIFGQEANKDLLIDFLNALFDGEPQIEDVQYLDKEQVKYYEENRSLVYDIYCTTSTGEHIIVEMQNVKQLNFVERALYYTSRAIVDQGETGKDWKYGYYPVYGVFFMNFTLSHLDHRFRVDVELQDTLRHTPVTDRLRMTFLQLPFFDKDEHSCIENLDKWIYILKHMEALERLPFAAQKAIFNKLSDVSDIYKMPKSMRASYMESLRIHRDNLAVRAAAVEEGREQGREEGREQGREQGRVEGIEQGIEQGVKKNQLATIQRLRQRGFADGDIIDLLGLTQQELEALSAQ